MPVDTFAWENIGRPLEAWPPQGHSDPLQQDQFCPGAKMPLTDETYLTVTGGINAPDAKVVEVKLLGVDAVPVGGRHKLNRLILEDQERNFWWISEARFRKEFRRGRLA